MASELLLCFWPIPFGLHCLPASSALSLVRFSGQLLRSSQVTRIFRLHVARHAAIRLDLAPHKRHTVSPELPAVLGKIRSRLRCKHSLEVVFAHFDLTYVLGRG